MNESGELAVTKFAVEPVSIRLWSIKLFLIVLFKVWYLPGVAKRFRIGIV